MIDNRDNFQKPIRDAIYKRAAYICSNPDCRRLTLAPSEANDAKFLFVGKASHITAAAPGGARYDPNMTQAERSSAANGIFLCGICADKIDYNKGLDYPTPLLQKWKSSHEKWVLENLNKSQSQQSITQTFTVSSFGQSGGITAGTVNLGPQQRKLNSAIQSEIIRLLSGESRTVKVSSVMNNVESGLFANQICSFLRARGYLVAQQQVMSGDIPTGVRYFSDRCELLVGVAETQ